MFFGTQSFGCLSLRFLSFFIRAKFYVRANTIGGVIENQLLQPVVPLKIVGGVSRFLLADNGAHRYSPQSCGGYLDMESLVNKLLISAPVAADDFITHCRKNSSVEMSLLKTRMIGAMRFSVGCCGAAFPAAGRG